MGSPISPYKIKPQEINLKTHLLGGCAYASAMVTSTSTPGSILMLVICLTISDGECRSITLLCIRIWNLSQVLEPSPQGVLRVVMRRILVGMRTGPWNRRKGELKREKKLLKLVDNLAVFEVKEVCKSPD